MPPEFTSWLKARTRADGDCRIWQQGLNSGGYPQCSYGGKAGRSVGRLVAEKANGRALKRTQFAVPSCGNRLCVSEQCLEVRERGSFLRDLYATGVRCVVAEREGRHRAAVRRGWAKLDNAKASQIRAMRSEKTVAQMAELFGVSEKTIYKVLRGERWPEAANGSSVFSWKAAA